MFLFLGSVPLNTGWSQRASRRSANPLFSLEQNSLCGIEAGSLHSALLQSILYLSSPGASIWPTTVGASIWLVGIVGRVRRVITVVGVVGRVGRMVRVVLWVAIVVLVVVVVVLVTRGMDYFTLFRLTGSPLPFCTFVPRACTTASWASCTSFCAAFCISSSTPGCLTGNLIVLTLR